MGFNYSAKIKIRKDYTRVDGTSTIYLQLIINNRKKTYPVGISWPKKNWDHRKGLAKSRHADDPDVDDYNLIIRDALSKANDIFKEFRLRNRTITHNLFDQEFNANFSKDSFFSFFEHHSRIRLRHGEITNYTYERYMGTLRKLKIWKKEILFAELNEDFAWEFDTFLRGNIKSRTGNTHNTRWNYHKYTKAMIRAAIKSGIYCTNPYLYYSNVAETGNWTAISETDLIRLFEYYDTTESDFYKRPLRRFLFSCTTGLRLGDLKRLEDTWVDEEGILTFMQQKTRRKRPKIKRLPLSGVAMDLFQEALDDHGPGTVFGYYADPVNNRVLQKIGESLGIRKRLHHHVGRHTFATILLRNGARLNTVKEYLDHSKIEITMIYDHQEIEDLRDGVRFFDSRRSIASGPSRS